MYMLSYYSFTDIKNIFSHTPSQNMLNFILKANLYDQLQFVNKKSYTNYTFLIK